MSWLLWGILIVVGGALALSLLITLGLRLLLLIGYWFDCKKANQYEPDWEQHAKERHKKGLEDCNCNFGILKQSLEKDGIQGDLNPLDCVMSLTAAGFIKWKLYDPHLGDREDFTAQLTEKIRLFLERDVTIWHWPLYWPYHKEVCCKLVFIDSGWLNPDREDRFNSVAYYWGIKLHPWMPAWQNNKKVKKLFHHVKEKIKSPK